MLKIYNNIFNICDAPRAWGVYFQDSASPQMEALVELHDNIMFYLVIILFGVGWILVSIIRNYVNSKSPISNKYLNHGTLIELIWTITPALILILIAFPSFKLLYLMDEVTDPSLTVFVEGNSKRNGGPKSFMLNKIENTFNLRSSTILSYKGRKNVQKYCYNICKNFHTKIASQNRIGPHNRDVLSVIFGSLLGDGYANSRTIEGVRFSFKQSIIHKDYLFYLYYFFFERGYCSNLEPRKYTRRLKEKTYYGYEFNVYTFRSLKWIHKMFYKKGRKYINPGIVNYITPLSLAIWIMDDGGWAKPGVRLATNSFTLEEVKLLHNMLVKKFNLDCTIQHLKSIDRYSIYIKGSSITKLKELVLPFLHPSMYYKLGL